MRTILFCTLVCAGCFDYERLSSGLAAGIDLGPEQNGEVAPDGAMAEVDLADVDLTGADLAGEDTAQPNDLAPSPADMTCAPQYTHSNGLGKTWTDCVPLGTYNDVQAMKACAASYAAGSCIFPVSGAPCSGKGVGSPGSGSGWTYFVYYGAFQGKVILPTGDCTIATGGTVNWN